MLNRFTEGFERTSTVCGLRATREDSTLELADKKIIAVAVFGAVLGGCAAPPPEPAPQPPPAPVESRPDIEDRFPSILFDSNNSSLSAAQRQQIREIAALLKAPHVANLSVLVEGHTDSSGSRSANLRISTKRAQAVANEFVFNGVAPERITVIGRGENNPVAPNTTPDGAVDREGQRLNRRVDVTFREQPGSD